MAEAPEEKIKREAYEASINIVAETARWDMDMLGLYKKSCENPSSSIGEAGSNIETFLKEFENTVIKVAGEHGKNTGQFYADVQQKKRKETANNEKETSTNIYKQAYVGAKAGLSEHLEGKWIKTKKVMHTLSAIPVAGKLFGWLGNKLKNTDTIRYEKFTANSTQIIKAREALEILDGEILTYQRMLRKIEETRPYADNEAAIQHTLLQIQNLTNERISKNAPIQKIEYANNKLWAEILEELETERKTIQNTFGIELGNLSRQRQILIGQLDIYNPKNLRHKLSRMKLREEKDACEIKIETVKLKITAYKSQRPIFLFEDLMGIQTTPISLNLKK